MRFFRRRMLKRPNRLWLLGLAAVAAVGVTLACSWIFQDNIARFLLNPRQPFQTSSPPPLPDYELSDAWAVSPLAVSAERPAVFVVHSTTYYGRASWNAPVHGSSADNDLERVGLPNEAGPFMGWADVYAPRYRQATLFARFTLKYEGLAAHERAYADIRMAFLAFLDRIPADQPIVLAGYGQGGLHILGLISEFFLSPENALVERLAVAYVIGQATPEDFLLNAPSGMSVCATPDTVRCLVAYVPFEHGNGRDLEHLRRFSMVWDARGNLQAAGEPSLLCVNPLDWLVHEEYVSADRHIGAASATGIELGRPNPAVAGAVGAACNRGILTIDKPRQRYLKTNRAFGAKWKVQSFNLFFHDLAENGQLRVRNLRTLLEVEAQRIEPIEEIVEIVDSPINQVPTEN